MSKCSRNLAVLCVVGPLATWMTGCASSTRAKNDARSESTDTCGRQIRIAPRTAEKLSGAAQQAWTQWQLQVCWARTGKYPTLNSDEVEKRRVSVIVTFAGNLDRLRAAGLKLGFSSDGRVSGIVAWSMLESLAAVDGVQEIEVEPEHKVLPDGL